MDLTTFQLDPGCLSTVLAGVYFLQILTFAPPPPPFSPPPRGPMPAKLSRTLEISKRQRASVGSESVESEASL